MRSSSASAARGDAAAAGAVEATSWRETAAAATKARRQIARAQHHVAVLDGRPRQSAKGALEGGTPLSIGSAERKLEAGAAATAAGGTARTVPLFGPTQLAGDDERERPNTDRFEAQVNLTEVSRVDRTCQGEDGQYMQVRQTSRGSSVSSDPRLQGELIVRGHALFRVPLSSAELEPIGQAIAKSELRRNGRTVSRSTAVRTIEPSEAAGIRLEGTIAGTTARAGGRFGGRTIANFTTFVDASQRNAQGSAGDPDGAAPADLPSRDPDDPGNTAMAQKGDCGLGFSERLKNAVTPEDD